MNTPVKRYRRPTTIHAEILKEVTAERLRQNQLVADGAHPFNCSSANHDDHDKIPILGEEFGEVCKAVYERRYKPERAESTEHCFALSAKYKQNLRTELIQVAAVAIAWAESLS